MNQQEKSEAIWLGIFLGFLLYFGLMEDQKKQIARLRAMRNRLAHENGPEIDAENLRKDWENIKFDLKKESQQVLQNVR